MLVYQRVSPHFFLGYPWAALSNLEGKPIRRPSSERLGMGEEPAAIKGDGKYHINGGLNGTSLH